MNSVILMTCTRPTQEQASTNPNMDGGGVGEGSQFSPNYATHVPVDGLTPVHILVAVSEVSRFKKLTNEVGRG